MGHVVFAAPSIRRFHLHERLARALRGRGHRASVVCLDRPSFSFYSAQGLPAWRPLPGPTWDGPAPLREFALDHCRLTGQRRGRVDAVERRLARLVGPVLRLFEIDPPDLLLLHQERSGYHRLLHFLAREMGCAVLWTGEGLLPCTMQCDGEGIDGDSRTARRPIAQYESIEEDDLLLAAALAALLGRTAPVPLARRLPSAPSLWTRCRDAVAELGCGAGLAAVRKALCGWRQAAVPIRLEPRPEPELPGRPFVALLLQHPKDPRLRLDAACPPEPSLLARATRDAAAALEPGTPVLAVLPRGGLPSGCLARLRRLPGVTLELPAAAPDAVAAAAACITVNHPLGAGALLAGTPVLHLGRTPYGLPGIAWRTTGAGLTEDLRRAVAAPPDPLQRRFLTWLLTRGHLWCDADHPDQNGLSGLVAAIETGMAARGRQGEGLRYRPGPAWPLASGG